MDTDWDLSHSFTADGQGFRCTAVLPSDNEAYRLVAGTQGGSLWEFTVPSGNMKPVEYQHNHAITAMIADKDCYVTGCKDSIVRVFSHAHELLFQLEGHEKAVTSLSWARTASDSSPQYLVSGSWDGTAKVWNMSNKSLVTTLEGHENTVSVCGLESESDDKINIATGSAGIAANNAISGHAVRIWEVTPQTGSSNLVNKVSDDHEGPIRDVSVTSLGFLASCSNDGTVKLRSVETGECLSTMAFLAKDPPMLLSVASVGEAIIATAEDGNVALWKGEQQTTLRHASCVWTATPLPDDDFATCCQDGSLRIFTQSTDRMAEQSERDGFHKSVEEALQKQRKGPSQEEISNLPKWEMNALQQGRSEGQVQVFNKGGIAVAAQWSAASRTWIEVGQVMGSSEDSGTIDGVQYDHVLPIEVDTQGGGVAKLKIGYNTGENPFSAAQRFIDAHMLPQHHLSEIADYIKQRVGNAAPTIGMDTDAGATASQTHVPIAYEHLPMKGYKAFPLTKGVNFEKMKTKMVETGNLAEKDSQSFDALTEVISATSRYHASTVDSSMLGFIEQMLKSWPSAQVFPALDLARLVVLHPDAAKDNVYWVRVLRNAMEHCGKVLEGDGMAFAAVPMLTLRLFSNCMKGGTGSLNAVVTVMSDALDLSAKYVSSGNKNIRLSVATFLLNVASYLHVTPDTPVAGLTARIVKQVNDILETRKYESEAVTRALVGLGTALLARLDEGKAAAISLFLVSKVEMHASPHGEKAKAVAREIYQILQ